MNNEFTRTAPVYDGYQIQLKIDSKNTLSTQLEMITGDGWNVIDWTDTLSTNTITHRKSGLKVYVLPKEQPTNKTPLQLLKNHVTGAIERGEAVAITEIVEPTRRQIGNHPSAGL